MISRNGRPSPNKPTSNCIDLMTYEALMAETVNLRGHNDDLINAHFARPLGKGPYPGVVLLHHMPGWDEAQKEMTYRFAAHGYLALMPNMHFREGLGSAKENSESIKAKGGMPDDRTMGDLQGGIGWLRELPTHNGKIGVIGYCAGGRQAYLAACTLSGIDAAVDCYGGNVIAPPDALSPRQPVAPITLTKDMSCPLLGLFGADDKRPSPQDIAAIEAELKKHNKTYAIHTYENCGHAFFHIDRPAYRVHAAEDGWKRVFDWFEKYLGA